MPLTFSSWSFLSTLAEQTRAGLAVLPPDLLNSHTRFILSQQTPDGGFCGRRGAGDLYYTAFATRALHGLNALSDDLKQQIASFVFQQKPGNILDLLNALSILALLNVETDEVIIPHPSSLIPPFRLSDGGYGKTQNDTSSSLYHSFLAVLCYDLIGEKPPDPDTLIAMTHAHRQPDGGFSETRTHPVSSCNPTAAGLSLLNILQGGDDTITNGVVRWLKTQQTPSGGWLAAPDAPAPDLLSTYTAVFNLVLLDQLSKAEMASALRFLKTCQPTSGGGFTAGPWDTAADVEYTSYGLSLLALAKQL
jgi:geranylgeranyl transferase type-2 subunit beta